MKSKIVVFLFGLPFAAVGIGMLLFAVLPDVMDGIQMRSWVPVKAKVLDAKLRRSSSDGSTTYGVTASYEYYVKDRRYVSERVSLYGSNDNVGDFQENLGRRLERSRGQLITVWVNPEDATDAIIVRDIRWGMLGFYMIFVVAFGGVGLGIIIFGVFVKGGSATKEVIERSDAPWLEHKAWASPVIYSNAKKGMWVIWFFAVIWNAISSPVVFVFPEEWAKGNHAILIGLLFPLVGIGLVAYAVKMTLNWRKFGRTPLTLNPYPGAIGGQVGGSIDTPTPYDDQVEYQVTLSCLYSYVSGSGKNRSRSERVVWQHDQLASTEPWYDGTRVQFVFDVPEGLPVSEVHGSTYHFWRVSVEAELPGVDYERQFEIPVFATKASSSLSHAGQSKREVQRVLERAIAHFQIESTSQGTELYFPAGRQWKMALMLFVFGAIFSGSGTGIFMAENGSGFTAWLFFLVFNLFGVGLMWGGLYTVGNSLRVLFSDLGIHVQRRVFGFRTSMKHMDRSSFKCFDIVQGSQTTTGSKTVVMHHIDAKGFAGQKLRVAESFRSRGEAEGVLQQLEKITGFKSR